MGLKIVVSDINEVPTQFQELYTEQDGQWVLTGVEGLKTQDDVKRLQTALQKERNDHKATKDAFAPLAGRKIEEVLEMLDKVPELEAAASGKIDDAKINEIVESRLRVKISPIERERNALAQKAQELGSIVEQYQTKERTQSLHESIRRAAVLAKVLPEAIEDALNLGERVFEIDEDGAVVTRDKCGYTPGVTAEVWFTELESKRPHWWAPNVGGGSRGSKGGNNQTSNPWSGANWDMTKQGEIYKQDSAKADQLARAAGTTVGGPRPAVK